MFRKKTASANGNGGLVNVLLIEGKNLSCPGKPAGDPGTWSVVIEDHGGRKVAKSKKKRGAGSVEWNEAHPVMVSDVSSFVLDFVLMQKDGLRSSEVSRATFVSTEFEFGKDPDQESTLLLGPGEDKNLLQVRVSLSAAAHAKLKTLESEAAAVAVAPPPPAPPAPPAGGGLEEEPMVDLRQSAVVTSIDLSRVPGVVRLKIVEAAFEESAVYFALIEEHRNEKGKVMKTKPLRGERPVWNEEFEFEVPDHEKWTIRVSLWNVSSGGESTRLGQATLSPLSHGKSGEYWVELDSTVSGRVRLSHNVSQKHELIIATPAKNLLNPMRKMLGRMVKEEEGEFQQPGMLTLHLRGNGTVGFEKGSVLIVERSGVSKRSQPADESGTWNEDILVPVENAENWTCNLSVELNGAVTGSSSISGSLATRDTIVALGPGKVAIHESVTLNNYKTNKRLSLASVVAASSEQRGPGQVKFIIFEGDNLLAREGKSDGVSEGYADAYARIDRVIGGKLGQKKNKTKVIAKTVYPKWNETFTLEVEDVSNWGVEISVWHKSFVGADKPEGHCTVMGKSTAQTLVKETLIDGKGRISIGYNVVSDETRTLLGVSGKGGAAPALESSRGNNPGYVRFFVYEANDLMAKDANGLSDPYVVICDTVDVDGKDCKTKVVRKNLSPKWNEAFTFMVANVDRWAVRLKIYDWDMLGKDELGYVDVVSTTLKEPKVVLNVVEGSGTLAVGWNVTKELPEDEVELDASKTPMPADRRGRLKIHVRSASGLPRACKTLVRLVDGALDHDVTAVCEQMTTDPSWGDWLEIDVPDLAMWVVQLQLLERAGNDILLAEVALQADKFNIGGSTDYKSLPLHPISGELSVGVAPVKEFKKLAHQIQRAKEFMHAEELRRARARGKTLMQKLGADGKYSGDVMVKLEDMTGADCVVYATVEGALTPTHESVKTEPFRVGDPKGWAEVFFLHLPDLANFSFTLNFWEVNSSMGLSKIFSNKGVLLGSVTVASLDLDLTVAESPSLQFRVGAEDRFAVRLSVVPTPKLIEVALQQRAESEAMLAQPIAWPEEREGVLRLHVIKAENLSVADIGGTSDPYIQVAGVFDTQGEAVRSRVIKKTLNPVWNQWFDIPLPDLAWFDLTVGLWDQDVAMDDTLGYVTLRAEDWDFADGEQIKTLKVVAGNGYIELGLAPTRHSQAVIRRILAAKKAGLAPLSGGTNKMIKGRNSGVLQLTFLSASNLSSADRNGLSDPYCMIPRNFFTDTKGREIRTKVIRKTLSPEWNEVFEFWTPDVRTFDFQITLWDWDLGKHDSLGYVHVRAQDFPDFAQTGKVRKCFKVEDGEGQLYIEIAASEGAKKILDRLAVERAEELAVEEEKRAKEAFEKHVRELCRDRLNQIRNMTPLFERKVTFDPFVLIAVAGLVLVAFTILLWLWQSRGVAVDAVFTFVVHPAMKVFSWTKEAAAWLSGLWK